MFKQIVCIKEFMYDGFIPIRVGDVYMLSSEHITNGTYFAIIDKISDKYPLKLGFCTWDIFKEYFMDRSELIDSKIDIIIK